VLEEQGQVLALGLLAGLALTASLEALLQTVAVVVVLELLIQTGLLVEAVAVQAEK
jgi:hypothetical protein